MATLHIDFETRSAIDLRKCGVDVYAADPSTDVWCMAWAFDDEPVAVWRMGQPLPARVRSHVESCGGVIGHNIGFEWAIWHDIMMPRYGWPKLMFEQCDCTAARAAAMSLPRNLAIWPP